jgi:hypothetical protein
MMPKKKKKINGTYNIKCMAPPLFTINNIFTVQSKDLFGFAV